MKTRNNLIKLNWIVFIFVVVAAFLTAGMTLYDLSDVSQNEYGDGAQSRLGFRWGSLHIIISIAVLVIGLILARGWKRLSPFNIPVTIMLVGLCYVLFFLTFTVGWVGIQGMLGFIIALLIGTFLVVFNSFSKES